MVRNTSGLVSTRHNSSKFHDHRLKRGSVLFDCFDHDKYFLSNSIDPRLEDDYSCPLGTWMKWIIIGINLSLPYVTYDVRHYYTMQYSGYLYLKIRSKNNDSIRRVLEFFCRAILMMIHSIPCEEVYISPEIQLLVDFTPLALYNHFYSFFSQSNNC